MATIRQNVERILKALGIEGVEIVDEMPDRVNALDTLGQLRQHIRDHPEHWMKDPTIFGRPLDPFHGSNVSGSYRERSCPSLQFVTHPISQINNPGIPCYDEMDVDFSPPDSPLNFLRHTAEVGHNLITGETTDQDEVARLLAERFEKEGSNTPPKETVST